MKHTIQLIAKHFEPTLDDKEPLSIFSKPSANTQFALPDSTICLAIKRAVDPVEQLLLTL